MISKVFDKHLGTIGASRARGVGIKSVARFYGVPDIADPKYQYIRETCKTHIDEDGSFSHVLGIDIDGDRGDLKPFNEQFAEVTVKAAELQTRLHELEDSPSEFTLLKNCASVCKVVHLMRAAGPYISKSTLEAFDRTVVDNIALMLGQQLDEEAKLQIGLPTNQGGLGLYRAESMALAAFLAARTEVRPFVDHLTEAFDIMFPSGGILKKTYDESLDHATSEFMMQLSIGGRVVAREKIELAATDAQ